MGKYCKYCGNQTTDGSRYCDKCGAPIVIKLANTAPSAPPSMKAQKSNGSHMTLSILLSILLVLQITAVTLLGWPGLLVKERPQRLSRTNIVDGIADLSDMTVDFTSSDFRGSELEYTKTSPVDLEEGAVSTAYEFAFSKVPKEAITLSAPIPADLTLAENEHLYLDIAFSMLDETSEKVMVYDHIEASEQAGRITAQIIPYNYRELESSVYLDGTGYVKPAYSDKMRFNAQFKVKLVTSSQSERFNLIFDRSRLMATSLKKGELESLLSRMEQTYAQYDLFSFDMSRRTKWPMDVYVTTLKNADATTATYGQYVSSWRGINYGYMNLSRLLFSDFNLDMATSVFAHELMHFVQECYVSTQYKRLGWLDEATAVFFEKYFGGKGDHSARQYELFDGIYPTYDSTKAGYARGSLISYWAYMGGWMEGTDALSGKDRMEGLIDLYSTGGYLQESKWYNWINDQVSAPSEYAIDLFSKILLGDKTVWAELALQPFTLHQVIVNNTGKKLKDYSSKLDLEYTISQISSELKLKADEIIGEDGQGYTVQVPAYGARVVAITMTGHEQNKIENDGTLIISSEKGEELVLIRALSTDVMTLKDASISTPDFLNMLFEKNRYLLLLVNTTEKKKDISFSVRMETEDEKDEYVLLNIDDVVGTYRECRDGEILRDGETLILGKDGNGFVLDGISFTYTSEFNSGYGLSTVYEEGDKIDIEFSFKETDGKIELFTFFKMNDGSSWAGDVYVKID